MLVVSIKIKNGLSQSGAPSGNRCAIEAFKSFVKVDKIKDNHSGRPIDSVTIRWLVSLKEYGFNPNKLIIISEENIKVIVDDTPFKLIA